MFHIRALYITDTHITAKNPASRLDTYYITTMRKFTEIGNIIKTNNIDIVFHGGDLFHSARISLKFAGEIASIMRSWGVPIYVVPGSHDMYGYNIDTIDQTMLGMYSKTGVVKILSRNAPLLLDIDTNKTSYLLSVEGQQHYSEMDRGNPFDYNVSNTTADLKILIAHGMLIPRAFHPDVDFTLIDDVVTDADILLTGHFHPGWDMVDKDGTKYFNPGSTLRPDSSGKRDMPKGIIFDIHEDSMCNGLTYDWEYVYFKSAQLEKDIFDLTAKNTVKQSEALIDQFKKTVVNTSSLQGATTIPEMVRKIASLTSINQDIIDEALRYISKAQISSDETLPEVKGFLEENTRIHITKAIIKNYQAGKDITVDFVDGFNAIIGESNSGKTAILRAIYWCLYNDPKGTDFITTGEDDCSVQLFFSNGKSLERKRTVSSAGSYIVTNADGTSNSYTGFNNDVPIEVINAHQMPEVYLAKDFKCRLNISAQLDNSFLISESPAVKASAIGRLIGTQTIDVAIKNINKESLDLNKEIKNCDKDIEANDKELKQYSDLDDMGLYIKLAESLLTLKEKTEFDVNMITSLDSEFDTCKKNIDISTKELSRIPNYDSYEADIELGFNIMMEMESIFSLMSRLDSVRTDIASTKEMLARPSEDAYFVLINEAEAVAAQIKEAYDLRQNRLQVYKEIKRLESEIICMNTSELEEILDVVDVELKKLDDAIVVYQQYCHITSQIKNCNHDDNIFIFELDKLKKNVIKTESEIRELLIKSGTCPLCNGELTEDHIKHMIGGI